MVPVSPTFLKRLRRFLSRRATVGLLGSLLMAGVAAWLLHVLGPVPVGIFCSALILAWVAVLVMVRPFRPETPEPELASAPAPPKNFFVPFPANPNFVGRQDLMLKLEQLLRGNQGPVCINQTVVAFVMGGIGKTQLAAEFCWRYADAFPDGVLWINAARGLVSEFSSMAYRLGITVERQDAPDAAQRLLAALQGHLSRHPKTLLILDNMGDPADANREVVPGFRPSALNCPLLITTRCQDLPRGTNPIRVDVLSLADAMTLLTHDFPPKDEREQASARVICKRLDGLPLAIEMVAAYLRSQRGAVSYYRYQINLNDRIKVIEQLKGDRPLPTHDPALLAVFQEQYESVKNADARLLFQMSGQMSEAEHVPRRRLELFSGLSDADQGIPPRPTVTGCG